MTQKPEPQQASPLDAQLQAAIRAAWVKNGKADGRAADLIAHRKIREGVYLVAYAVNDPTFGEGMPAIVHILDLDATALFHGTYDLAREDAVSIIEEA